MDTITTILMKLLESSKYMDYKRATDEELVTLSNQNDKRATEELLSRYEKLVKKIATTSGLYVQGGTSDDLAQEGMLGFWEAISKFVPGKNKNFQQFALNVAKRRMIDAVRTSTTQKNSPLNKSSDIDTMEKTGQSSSADRRAPRTSLPMSAKTNPELKYIEKEDYEKLKSFIKTGLTSLEQQVLNLYLQGYNYEEIGKKIGRSKKSADNAMNMVRSKLRAKGYSSKLKDSKIIILVESILIESDRYNEISLIDSLRESIIRDLYH